MRHFMCACLIIQYAIFPVGMHALRRGTDHKGRAFVVVDARGLGNHSLNHSVLVASDNDQGNQSGVEGLGTSSVARVLVGDQGEGSDASLLDSLVEESNVVNMTSDGIRRAGEMIKNVQKSQNVDFAERDRQRLRRIPSFIGSGASTFAPSSFLQTPPFTEEQKNLKVNQLVLPEEINVRAEALHHLGSGASGHVYELDAKCDDEVPNYDTTKVALKVMEERNNNRLLSMRQFRIEAKLMERLISPYVLPSYGPAVEDNRKMFLMMPLANGGSLLDVLMNAHGSIPSRVALWFQSVIGLAYMHRRGVTHMDMKPDNVVVECKGQGGAARWLSKKRCRALVADVGMVCASKDWIRFDIESPNDHRCGNTDTMSQCLKTLYEDAQDGEYVVYKESDYKEEILSSDRLREQKKPLNDTTRDWRRYFAGDYRRLLKKYYGKVYSKDNLAFKKIDVFFDEEKYPLTIIYYAYPDGCSYRGSKGYISPITYKSQYRPFEPFGRSDADIWSMASMLYSTFKLESTPWAAVEDVEDATLKMVDKVPLDIGVEVMFGVHWKSRKLNDAWKAWDELKGGCPGKRSNDVKFRFTLGKEVVVRKICQTQGMTFFSPSFSENGKWAPAIAIMRVNEFVDAQDLRDAPWDMKELIRDMLTDAGSIDLGEIMQMMPQVMEGLSPGNGEKYEQMINLVPDPSAYMYTPPKCLSYRHVPLRFNEKRTACTEEIEVAQNSQNCAMRMPPDSVCCRCIKKGTGQNHYWKKQVQGHGVESGEETLEACIESSRECRSPTWLPQSDI